MKLVGTIRWDLKGTRRLEYLLDKIKPRIITIEFPTSMSVEEAESMILESRSRRIKTVQLLDIHDTLKEFYVEMFSTICYDSLVPIQYAEKGKIEVYPIDHPGVVPPVLQKDLDKEEIKIILNRSERIKSKPYQITYDEFRRAWNEFNEGIYLDPSILKDLDEKMSPEVAEIMEQELSYLDKEGFDEERERYMAEEIIKRNPELHVAGLGHVFEAEGVSADIPLYALLGNRISERIKLCDAFRYKPATV